MNSIELSREVSIPALEYAAQGNAILGIRESGKSYTATKVAEQLLEAKIPFVAFDPIGVWRHLKVGRPDRQGYQVVVAGDEGDLPLTVESAPRIVRAAMRENVPLVIDLYSMKLSKADWRRIVEESVRILLYENKQHGLRHVFLEEAAEFVPQRVPSDYGRVYAEIEKLGRMGGNASLGFTLINQRPEEINKAVLELCDCLMLHRQKGRHSLTALGKWLSVAGADTEAQTAKQVTDSMPMLAQGECWVWLQGSTAPVRTQVFEKNTVHPDRRNPQRVIKGVAADVSQFVAKLKTSLETQKKAEAVVAPIAQKQFKEMKDKAIDSDANVSLMLEQERSKVAKLDATVKALRGEVQDLRNDRLKAERGIEAVKKLLRPQYEAFRRLFEKLDDIPEVQGTNVGRAAWEGWMEKLGGGRAKIIETMLGNGGKASKQQLIVLTGLSRESIRTYTGQLVGMKLLVNQGDGEYSLAEI